LLFHRLRLQIPPSPLRSHFVRSTVKVRQYQGRQPRGLSWPALHRPIRRAGRPTKRGGGMKLGQARACGFMDNARALPTTPQAPHQTKQGFFTFFRKQPASTSVPTTKSPDLPPERHRFRQAKNNRNRPETSGQLECYVNRTS
jgi:hypothetical protein